MTDSTQHKLCRWKKKNFVFSLSEITSSKQHLGVNESFSIWPIAQSILLNANDLPGSLVADGNPIPISRRADSFAEFFKLSAFHRNCFLCQDRWKGDMIPSLDAALLCSSRAGSDLGRESRLVWGAIFPKLLDTIKTMKLRLSAWFITLNIFNK